MTSLTTLSCVSATLGSVPLPGTPLSTGTVTDALFRSLSSGTVICMQSTRSSTPYRWSRHGSPFHLLDHVSG